MKHIPIILLIALFSLQACGQTPNDTDTIISNNPKNLKLKVLYFHITNRCNTCRSIEANVKKTLDENFMNEVETGVIDFYIVNCELKENEELVKKYEAYGATLAITSYQNEKEQKTEDLTNWAFQKAHDQGIFVSELKSKIETIIK